MTSYEAYYYKHVTNQILAISFACYTIYFLGIRKIPIVESFNWSDHHNINLGFWWSAGPLANKSLNEWIVKRTF